MRKFQAKIVPLSKAGGPFIGPRGGKWADAAHTIPWVEGHHAEITEDGLHFRTGKPVEIKYTHRNQKTVNFGATYGQDIEPAGRYILHGHHGTPGQIQEPGGHTVLIHHGTVRFQNPLVIHHGGTGGEPGMWKRRLSDEHKGKKGGRLSRSIAKQGHDAVITVDKYGTSEIVDLRGWVPRPKAAPSASLAKKPREGARAVRAAEAHNDAADELEQREAKKAALAHDLAKAGGPYIGPRGGLWADAQHTIPYRKPGPGKPGLRDRGDLLSDDDFSKEIGEWAGLAKKLKRGKPGTGHHVDLSKPELDHVLKTGTYGLVSAGKNPKLEPNMSDAEQKARHEKLRKKLQDAGLQFTEVKGHYGGVEDSFLVMAHDIKRDELKALGKELNQDSVIFSDRGKHEMHFTTGEHAGEHHKGEGHEEKPDAEDFFTVFKHPDGSVTKFALNFDWDKLHKALRLMLIDRTLRKTNLRLYVPLEKGIKGQQAATHKYIKRTPDGKGGWTYYYRTPQGQVVASKGPMKGADHSALKPAVRRLRNMKRKPQPNQQPQQKPQQPQAQAHASPEAKLELRLKSDPSRETENRVWPESTDFGLPESTEHAHSKDGQYTPERQKLHAAIIDEFTKNVKPVPEGKRPVAIVMMGGGGSGKGTIKKAVYGSGLSDFVNVDPDEVKDHIPEYQKALDLGKYKGKTITAKNAAFMAHEESSHVADQIRKKAMAERKNLVLDGTGKDAEKYAAKLKALKDQGYHVQLVYAHVEAEEAVRRAKERADRGGRFVPLDVLEDAHKRIPGNFQFVAAHADEAVVFHSKNPPSPLFKQPPPTAVDEEGWKKFQAIGAKGHQELGVKLPQAAMGKAEGSKMEPAVALDEVIGRVQKHGKKFADEDFKGPLQKPTDGGLPWPELDYEHEVLASMKKPQKAPLQKGARGGKYYRRVPTGDKKRPYRYYYSRAEYEREHGDSAHLHGPDVAGKSADQPFPGLQQFRVRSLKDV